MQPQEPQPQMPPQGFQPSSLNQPPPQPPMEQSVAPQMQSPTPAPANTQQPVMQPTPGQFPGAISGLQINVEKDKKQAFWLGIASLIFFVIGLLLGFAGILGALLGAFGLRKAKLIGYKAGLYMGIAGVVLNLGFYMLVITMG